MACWQSDRLNLEVKGDQAENKSLEILHKIIEDTQAFRIGRFRNVVNRANFCSLQAKCQFLRIHSRSL